jgi:F-type H+-transporting ATPase subunit b
MAIVTPQIGLIFWTAILFTFVLIILGKFAFKPIANALEERKTSIDKALKAADHAKEEMKQLQSENENLLRAARSERDKMMSEAKVAADKMIADAKDSAKNEADKIIKSAQAAIQSEKMAAMAEVKQQVASISLAVAEKVIRKELDNQEAQQALVKSYLQELKLN